ncbi:T9SS type A sorting domain-containing protein [Flavobacterium maritimum]|uniref:T9SS type A sorting domain-containing protein n=1 Tax=Flavobacterium maritimum TaxID=3149042 RepID=UPI0032B334A4
MEKITLLTFFELVISKIRACFLSKNKIYTLDFFKLSNTLWGRLPSPLKKAMLFFLLCLSFSNTFAQTTTTFPSPDRCTSKDLELVSATLTGGDACNSCTPDSELTRTLTLGINNKTGSKRTAFAFWGTLERTDSDGNVTTEAISRCSDATPIPPTGPLPAVYTGGNFGTITYECGSSLRLVDLYLAWTDASPKSTCASLNSATISPKCGTLPSIEINVGVNGTLVGTNVICYGASTGAIALTPSGGTGPYTYDWSDVAGSSNSEDRSGLAVGTYTVIITDSKQCSITKSITITGPTAGLSLGTCTKTDVSCEGGDGSVTAGAVTNAVGTVSYSWKNSSNVVVGTSASVPNLPSGTYTLTVSDDCSSKTCTVTVGSPPSISTPAATVTQPDCDASTGTVTVTSPVAGITYTLKQEGDVIYTAVDGVFSSVAPGTYALIAADGICSAAGDNVVVDAQPITPDTPEICVVQPSLCGPIKGSVTILSPIGDEYEYSIDNGATWQTDPYFPDLDPGSVSGVKVKKGDCVSGAASCDASNCDAKLTAKKIESIAPEEKKLDTETSKVGFDAYPVPFKNILNIKYNFDYVSNVRIDVFNSQGVLVLSKNDTNSYLNKEVALDLKTNNGQGQVYIVKLTTDRGSSVKKIISSR